MYLTGAQALRASAPGDSRRALGRRLSELAPAAPAWVGAG
jgi:hypothetical protein